MTRLLARYRLCAGYFASVGIGELLLRVVRRGGSPGLDPEVQERARQTDRPA